MTLPDALTLDDFLRLRVRQVLREEMDREREEARA